jgi:pimeloyl-ACP methyl ester carboxylesterase
VHVLAEGQARDGRPPVVWFAGGHAGGFAMHHLHRAFRGETRSILIDRPGTGWSDAGPFPRTTAREADEMVLALERAG